MNRRTHYCKDISVDNIGQTVVLYGWVMSIRNKGSIIWLDVRDSSGILQAVHVKPKGKGEDNLYQKLASLKRESVIQIEGVIKKSESVKGVELRVHEIEILSISKNLPFDIRESKDISEDISLKYRYLDMRRKSLRENLILRNRVTLLTRTFLEKENFIEVRTPHLVRPTRGGAKEFLVETEKGDFFALSQGPQIYMELMMAGGFDRCYQISHCICNEGSRRNRQIEFDQLHCELAFMDENQIMELFDKYIRYLCKNILGKDIYTIPRVSWKDAIEKFGNDCPDIRSHNDDFCPIWITDIPMFKIDKVTGKYKIMHHPFTAVRDSDFKYIKSGEYQNVISQSYNLSINGIKVGGSSVRNYKRDIQEKLLELSGVTREEMEGFSSLLKAMDYGMPPHAGMSFGFDRLCAIFGNSTIVKDFMFFPKSNSGKELMTGAPISK